MQNHKVVQNQAPAQSPVRNPKAGEKPPVQNTSNFPQSTEKDNN
jgi:hypothetical protein